jgi:hypothetical protein
MCGEFVDLRNFLWMPCPAPPFFSPLFLSFFSIIYKREKDKGPAAAQWEMRRNPWKNSGELWRVFPE